MEMSKEELEALMQKCYNPSITQFRKEDSESWADDARGFAEQCNYVPKEDAEGE